MRTLFTFKRQQGVTIETPEGDVQVIVNDINGRGKRREADLEIISGSQTIPFHLNYGERIRFLENQNVSVKIDKSERTSGKYVRLNYFVPEKFIRKKST